MHILYLHQYFVPPDGSGGTRSYEMARRLVKAGHRVTMITSSALFPKHYAFSQARTTLMVDDIELCVLRVEYSNRMSFFRRSLAFVQFMVSASRESLRVARPDVIFATSTPLTIAVPAIIAKIWRRCPMVFEVRDLWPELPIAIGAIRNPLVIFVAKQLEKAAYYHSKRIVALSPGMADGIYASGVPHDKVVTISNSCDLELFQGTGANGQEFLKANPHLSGEKLVVYAGTLGLINGVEYLVCIAEEMLKLDKSVRFLICGDGKEFEKIEKMAQKRNVLGCNLWMCRPLPKAQMPALFAAANISCSLFVDLPQMWANSANKFFDTLASGTPILINYKGWQAELIEQTGCGLVVPPDDPYKAALAMIDLLNDKDRLRSAGEAGLKLAKTTFSRDMLAQKLRKTLEAVAGAS